MRKPAKRKPVKSKPAKRKPAKRKPAARKPSKSISRKKADLSVLFFEKLKERLGTDNPSLSMHYRVFTGEESTDGQMVISNLNSIPYNEMRYWLLDIEQSIHPIVPKDDGWFFSIGFLGKFDPARDEYQARKRAPDVDDKERKYQRFQGLDRIYIHAREVEDALASHMVTARQILDSLRKKKRYKPEAVLLRLWWSKQGGRPPRKKR